MITTYRIVISNIFELSRICILNNVFYGIISSIFLTIYKFNL